MLNEHRVDPKQIHFLKMVRRVLMALLFFAHAVYSAAARSNYNTASLASQIHSNEIPIGYFLLIEISRHRRVSFSLSEHANPL